MYNLKKEKKKWILRNQTVEAILLEKASWGSLPIRSGCYFTKGVVKDLP